MLGVRILEGDALTLLAGIPDGSVQCVISSPPYNIGKEYERRAPLSAYIDNQTQVIARCAKTLRDGGSLCWQVGNYVDDGEIVPLDAVLYPAIKAAGLKLRNRIVWTFGHGQHASRRFSGRHETVLWATKGDDYLFNLDPIRVPQKYPGKKHFKGPRAGQLSGNPLGKNPGDVWDIVKVKHNHPEKTEHPCQFPEELVTRWVLSLSHPGDTVLDPYLGSGTTAVVAARLGRLAVGMELNPAYIAIAERRLLAERNRIVEDMLS